MFKKKKVLKSISSLVLAMVLAIGGFASNVSAEESAKAYITKYLNIVEGTDVPTVDFNFNFVAKDDAPAISGVKVAYDGTETIDSNNQIIKSTNDVLAGKTFPHAGVFTYDVTEDADTFENSKTAEMTFSHAEYKMYVSVVNGTDGGLYVQTVSVERIKDDAGNPITDGDGSEGGVKVEPGLPGGEGGDPEGSNSDEYFSFNNAFVTIVDGGGEEPGVEDENVGLLIGNEVAGDLGDQTLPFTYDITITAPSTTSKTTFEYFIAEFDGSKWTPIPNTKTDYKTGTYGQKFTETLTHNQAVMVIDVITGTSIAVNQKGMANYLPSVMVKGVGTTTGTVGDDLAASAKVAKVKVDIDYTNTYDDTTTPTGLIINNLPLVALGLIIIAGFAFCVAPRRNKEEI